jgi:hypothetical protein
MMSIGALTTNLLFMLFVRLVNVRFWYNADLVTHLVNVRFWGRTFTSDC